MHLPPDLYPVPEQLAVSAPQGSLGMGNIQRATANSNPMALSPGCMFESPTELLNVQLPS